MTSGNLFADVIDPAARPDPYPIYARLRETPVARQDNGIYVVSTYDEIRALLLDSRLSSKVVPKPQHAKTGNLFKDWILNPLRAHIVHNHRSLVFRDPPEHDAMRRHILVQFTPARMQKIKIRIHEIVDELITKMQGRTRIDLVADFAYPLPVTVICELLGVPHEDEKKFHGWSTSLVAGLDPDLHLSQEAKQRIAVDNDAISSYLAALIRAKRRNPANDILSGLATHKDEKAGKLHRFDIISTAVTLLVAGHETTVNLIANGMLTLLRNPDVLAKLRADPALAPRLVDEILRFEPPAQFVKRKALEDIEIAGERIPRDAPVVLLLAAGNRDPKRFENPERFDPDRKNNQHFSFGAGLHFCIGAALAKSEAEAALTALAKRLIAPTLAADPPPYRAGAALRGPQHLYVDIKGVV
ncbi:cytochrome P450 [Methylocapsa palsarum]|uniref:Cytochrome P450 n=1 Tax=Methylocapsa palsarum TaxID=1612308 RepID=A0A1I3XIV3_9HYPH|nr:cytochrome P450 [Methylocapsa palsarum]SFK19463.1 Cytochrome P450 [Methylocapsa palsarum]